jgi:hypothetical protein
MLQKQKLLAKDLEAKTFTFYTRSMYTIKSITAWVDPNLLLQEDSSNDAHGKIRHPLEAT